jgi:replication-associated recombination protein RarA
MRDKKVWEMRTKSGLPLDEAVSWFQKSLRRADEITALWLMEDLLVSGFQRYALYRRLE